jgi:hypothetical protein
MINSWRLGSMYCDDCAASSISEPPPRKRRRSMSDDDPNKLKLAVVPKEELDEEEAEFQKLRRDLPGVKGASAIGIV